jgi:hypothetical protein
VSDKTGLQNILIANAPDLENVTSACYFYKNNRTAVTIDFRWANNTLFLIKNNTDLSQNIPIADLG